MALACVATKLESILIYFGAPPSQACWITTLIQYYKIKVTYDNLRHPCYACSDNVQLMVTQ